jgi:hypothetical protein
MDKYTIKIQEDFISISDSKGEIVYWNCDEWKENPNLVLVIANTLKLAYLEKDLRKLLK